MKFQVGTDIGSYTFNVSTRTVVISGIGEATMTLDQVQAVINAKAGKILYQIGSEAFAATSFVGVAGGGTLVLNSTLDLMGQLDADALDIIIQSTGSALPTPTAPEGDAQSWAPGYNRSDLGGGRVNVDQSGALVARALCLTDEGTVRANFANTSLAVNVGAVTIVGDTVTGTFPDTLDLHWGDYFKLDADADTAWMQVSSKDSASQFTLVGNYVGGASGNGSRALVKPFVGTGASVTVASGAATLSLGTTTNAITGVSRRVDYGPLVARGRVTLNQRIINQDILFGLREDVAVPRWFARFRFNGTVNTVLICETGRNPTVAPTANEQQSTIAAVPNGLTTATARDLRVELLTESVRFFCDGVMVADHTITIPATHDTMAIVVEGINGTAPGSSTAVTIDNLTCKNHDKLECGIFSDAEKILASAVPDVSYNYNVAGVIAINTDLLVIDMSQAKAASIQLTSLGTTGNVTFYATNDLTQVGTPCAAIPVGGGAFVTSTNAAGMWDIPKQGKFLRVRLTTATTAGTTTIFAISTQYMPPTLATLNQGGTWTMQPGNTPNSTAWLFTPVPSSAQGAGTPHRLAFVTNITTGAPTSVKTSGGTINSGRVANNSGVGVWAHFYNKASAPTMGTDTPIVSLYVKAGDTFAIDSGAFGDRFSTGIAYAICDNCAAVPTAGGTITIATTAAAICVSFFYT